MKELCRLFIAFFKIGLFTFGGGLAMLPLIQRTVVEDYKWMTEEEMLDCIAVTQAMPGVIAVNAATYIGNRRKGFAGSLAATLGVILPSFIIIILAVLFLGAIGATICYLTAAVFSVAVVGLVACALTGLCTSMLWPGNLIVASDRFPSGGVMLYALMAAGGDFGASVGPQLIGIITDAAAKNSAIINVASQLQIAPDQIGMRIGMLVGMLFPLMAIPLYNSFRKNKKQNKTVGFHSE